MTDLLNFMAENPWQTFFLGPFVFVVFAVCCHYIFLFYNRLLRTVKVLFRGWPPEHIDADGDFYKPETSSS